MDQTRSEETLAHAVSVFLAENAGSVVVAQTSDAAILRTGGFTPDQVKAHALACIVSLGLWLPVWFIIGLLRIPRGWVLKVDQETGEVEIREL